MTEPIIEKHDQEMLERRRIEVGKFFENTPTGSEEVSLGKYRLLLEKYPTKPGCWNYCRGRIYLGDKLLADIKRNYGHFQHFFIENHPVTGHDYLLCGEDYQGYNVVDLTTGENHAFLSADAKQGFGWCWASIENFDRETCELTVEGCFWASPYDCRVYDFKNPSQLPLPILREYDPEPRPDDEDDEDDEDEE